MEDIQLIYPDFKEIIILNYFKGTVITNNKNATFLFENNILKIKWDDKEEFENFLIDSNSDQSVELESIRSYVYFNNKLNNNFESNSLLSQNNNELTTSIFIEDSDFEDYFLKIIILLINQIRIKVFIHLKMIF